MPLEEVQAVAGQRAMAVGKALGLDRSPNRVGKYNPGDYTPQSWSSFMQAGGNDSDSNLLVRYEAPSIGKVGGVSSIIERSGGSGSVTPLSTIQNEAQAQAQIVGAQEQSKLEQRLATEPKIARDVSLAKASAGVANKAYASLDTIKGNILNLQDAAQLVRDGASTGAIMSRLPSLRNNSIALDNMQGRLGLDVVGAVTFGALSKGELDLAKSVALPTGLDGPELIEWIDRKVSAQTKLSNYLEEQANFLSQGGTQAHWRKMLKDKQQSISDIGLPSGTTDNGDGTFTLPDGQKIRKANANP